VLDGAGEHPGKGNEPAHYPNLAVGLGSPVMLPCCHLQCRALKGVDDMIGELVAKLDALGQLDNTYIVYVSDNGFQLGQHGLNYEKFTPFGKHSQQCRMPGS
jgi:hypothetical protein